MPSMNCPSEPSPLWEVDVPALYHKFITEEVGPDGSQARWNTRHQTKEKRGGRPAHQSLNRRGQGKRPGVDEGVFGVHRGRLKYKWVNCADWE